MTFTDFYRTQLNIFSLIADAYSEMYPMARCNLEIVKCELDERKAEVVFKTDEYQNTGDYMVITLPLEVVDALDRATIVAYLREKMDADEREQQKHIARWEQEFREHVKRWSIQTDRFLNLKGHTMNETEREKMAGSALEETK